VGALAAVVTSTAPAGAGAGRAATTSPCPLDQVTVVVDFNEIGGDTRSGCATPGASAAQVFERAGFALTYATTPAMHGFVCTVAGAPADRRCTQGDAYWSLWWSDGSTAWSYATLGVDQLEPRPGGYVGFAWHQGGDKASAPDVPVGAPAAARAGSRHDEGSPAAGESDDGGFPAWLGGGLVVVVLAAAAVVPVLRRRRG